MSNEDHPDDHCGHDSREGAQDHTRSTQEVDRESTEDPGDGTTTSATAPEDVTSISHLRACIPMLWWIPAGSSWCDRTRYGGHPRRDLHVEVPDPLAHTSTEGRLRLPARRAGSLVAFSG